MDLVDLSTLRSVAEMAAHQREVAARVSALHDEAAGRPFNDEQREEFAQLVERNKEIDTRIVEFSGRQRMIAELARDPRNVEREESPSASPITRTIDREGLSLGLRAIDRHSAHLSKAAGERLEGLVRAGDPPGLGLGISTRSATPPISRRS